jgi:hypothetical protein
MTIRGPLITPIARPRAPQQPGILANLLLSTLAPAQQAPFRQQEWPNPVRRSSWVQPWSGQTLLQTTLAPAEVVQAPFNQQEWLNPQRAGLQSQQWLAGNLLQTTLAPIGAPFNQFDWPNPVRARASIERHVLYGVSYFTEAESPPPVRLEFQNPVIRRSVQQPQVLPNLLLGTLFTAPTTPRICSELQNPVIGRKPQQPQIFPNLVLGPLFAAPTTPTIRSEFQNPVIARRVQQPEVFPNLGLNTLFAAPFRQQEWPNPTLPRRQLRPDIARMHFGQLAALPVALGALPNISAGYNTGTHQYELGDYFSGATSYAIAPAVEAGWTFNTGTGQLEIDTDAEATFGPYTITASNANGDTDSNAFSVKVGTSTIRPYRGLRGVGGLRNYS